jgi:hypothetical protein
MTIKDAGWIALWIAVIILAVAAVCAVRKRSEIRGWDRVSANIVRVQLVPQASSDAYGIRLDLEYEHNGRKKLHMEPRSFGGPYHGVAKQVDDLNRDRKTSLLVNPAKEDDVLIGSGFTLDIYIIPFILSCVGGFVLFVAMILLVGTSTKGLFYFFAAWGIIALIAVVPVLVRSIQRAGWPPVTANIESVDIVLHVDNKGNYKYAPRLWLAYSSGGRDYRSVYVGYYQGGTGMKSKMDKRIREWKEKGRIDMRYNPANPYELADGAGFAWVLLPLGLAAVFLGCAVMIRRLVLS